MRGLVSRITTILIRAPHVRFAILGVFLSLPGCAAGTASNPFTENTARDVFNLRVVSRNSYDVTIYVDLEKGREVLATIRPRSIQYLEFRYPAGRPLRLEVESILGDRYRLPPGASIGGGRFDLIIEENIRRSVYIRGIPDPEGLPSSDPSGPP